MNETEDILQFSAEIQRIVDSRKNEMPLSCIMILAAYISKLIALQPEEKHEYLREIANRQISHKS